MESVNSLSNHLDNNKLIRGSSLQLSTLKASQIWKNSTYQKQCNLNQATSVKTGVVKTGVETRVKAGMKTGENRNKISPYT